MVHILFSLLQLVMLIQPIKIFLKFGMMSNGFGLYDFLNERDVENIAESI